MVPVFVLSYHTKMGRKTARNPMLIVKRIEDLMCVESCTILVESDGWGFQVVC
jgi:hypothetical protein